MKEFFKYSLDGLIYSQTIYNNPTEAAVGAYLQGGVDQTDLINGVTIYIGRLVPLRININIDNLLDDIRNDLSEYASGGRLYISAADKMQLQDYISNFIMERNANMYDIHYIGNVLLNRNLLQNHAQSLKTADPCNP